MPSEMPLDRLFHRLACFNPYLAEELGAFSYGADALTLKLALLNFL